MNKLKLIGVVKFNFGGKENNIRDFGDKRVMAFQLNVIGDKKNELDCSTWVDSYIDDLQDGVLIELTRYLPTKQNWIDKKTNEWKTKTSLNVYEMDLDVRVPVKASSNEVKIDKAPNGMENFDLSFLD